MRFIMLDSLSGVLIYRNDTYSQAQLKLIYKKTQRMIHLLRRAKQSAINSALVLTQKHSSLKVLETEQSQDLNLRVTRSKHTKSGAIIYQIHGTGDSEAAFAPIIKTLPQNDTGCPHILEHLSCCGSSLYPIRDPFFNMLKRSINSYMNAWTGGDFTAYPFSSPNQKDFSNLYKVYLDMVFQPKLNQLDFRQQGWRYQFDSNEQGKQTKTIKGIVYNQMKGAYQNPQRQMYIHTNQSLFRGTPYGFDSGGDPNFITQLSYKQLLDMHNYYYHPSNMSFFFYSDSNFQEHFEYLERSYLQGYGNRESEYPGLISMPRNDNQIYHQFGSSSAESISLSLTYRLDPLEDITGVESHCLSFLSYLLCETNQALIYQHFIETGFADSIGQSGFDLNRFGMFRVTLKNVKDTQTTSKIQQLLLQKFEEIIKNLANGSIPIDDSRLLSYMTQKQLQLLTPKQNNGIHLLQQCLPFLNNRLKLINLFNIRKDMQEAIKIIRSREKLSKLLRRTFIANNHKVVVKQIPKRNNSQQKQRTGLQMPQDVIREQQQKLKARQSQPNNSNCLPKLEISDLIQSKQNQHRVVFSGSQKSNNKGLTFSHIKIGIKDIHFVRISFKLNISLHNQHLLKAIELWKHTINKGIGLSTTRLSNKQLVSKLQQCSRDFHVQLLKGSNNEQAINVTFYASCTRQGLKDFLALLREILEMAKFNDEDCSHSFRSFMTEYVEELSSMPMGSCLDQASAMVGGAGKLHNSYFSAVQGLKLAQKQAVPRQFQQIMQLLSESELTIIEHSQKPTNDILSQLGILSCDQQPQKVLVFNNHMDTCHDNVSNLCVTHAYNVNFCTQQYAGPSIFSLQHAEMSIFLEILQQQYLHPRIRQQGGAYGARAMVREIGVIALYSYMDPHAEQTFQNFENSIKDIFRDGLTEQSIKEAKIKALGLINRPIPPQKSCVDSILKNISLQHKQQFKQYLRNAPKDRIIQTAQKYLQADTHETKRVVFGCKSPKDFHTIQLEIPKLSKHNETNSSQQ